MGHQETQVPLKNCVPFTKWITKIVGTRIDDVLNLNLAMSMYNLMEYSSNLSETTGSLWFCSKDKATNFNADIANVNNFKSFKYDAKLSGNKEAQPNPNNVNRVLENETLAVSLKYLSNLEIT